ncbi:MAG: hypothetical protein RMJ33_06040 [Saprospiraceae bacterium]|nr:hypothetical protein [Saprospiraceae bacterium]MDW8229379.1 hypothetical protein [Saprospiraceae bacterium]
MPQVIQTPNGIEVPLIKPRKFLGERSSASVRYTVNNAPDVLFALLQNQPFPQRVIRLSEVSAQAGAGGEGIQFANGQGTVSFQARGRVASGMAIYPDPALLLRELGLEDDISPGLPLKADPASNYLLLRWAYAFDARGKGNALFGSAAAASASAEGRSEGLFAIVRRLPKDMGAAEAVFEATQNWLLPAQITSADDLEPGTWLIAEVDSSIAAGLQAQYGFLYSWVRETQAQGLSGDIGLHLQLGATAGVGFQASGRFAVVVSREGNDPKDRRLRIRLFKQRQRGWSASADVRAGLRADLSRFLPPNLTDFVRAAFGAQGLQVLKDLEDIEAWTSPDADLPGMLAGLSSRYFQKFVKDTTKIDPKTAFDEAKKTLQTWLDRWNELDHEVASFLWKQAEKKVNLTKIRAFNEQLRQMDAEKAQAFLRQQIEKVDFFQTLGGQFLLALLPEENVLTLLSDRGVFQQVRERAQKAAAILDGSAFTDLLVRLQNQLNKRLRVEEAEKWADDLEFEQIDEWLRLKMARFLDEKAFQKPHVRQVRETVHRLLAQKEVFYEKALQALQRHYGYGLSAAFQKSASHAALVDLTVDGAKARTLLRQALLGRFDAILTAPKAGVTLHEGTLTHGIRTQSSIAVQLPFAQGSGTFLNESLAKASAIDEANGRIFVYDLKATDTAVSNRTQMSALTIGAHVRTSGNRVRVYDERSLTYAYSFQQLRPAMHAAELKCQVKPYAQQYLSEALGQDADAAVDAWVEALERDAERLHPNGAGLLGDTLLRLDVTLPAQVASAWLRAPLSPQAPEYTRMSRNLQRRMRELIPLFYFQDARKYGEKVAPALVAYSAMIPTTGFRREGNRLLLTDDGLYWNWPDTDQRRALLLHPGTQGRLRARLQEIHDLIQRLPGLPATLRRTYDPGRIEAFTDDLLNLLKEKQSGFDSLFFTEATIIEKARDAGVALARFLKEANSQPARAVRHLAEFGAAITEAFNQRLAPVYGDTGLRPLGTALFVEAAQAFLPAATPVRPQALLQAAVLKPDSGIKPDPRTPPTQVAPEAILVCRQLSQL